MKVPMYQATDHSFIICAYKQSQYLEDCIKSLFNQTVKSDIIIATSTPNYYIDDLARKYGIAVYINDGETGIAGDWNFALSCAKTKLVTIAHQDDVYLPNYTMEMLRRINSVSNPIIFSSNYGELRDDVELYNGMLINVKRMMTIPMSINPCSISARRFAISYGNGICCPTVTYVTDIINRYPFNGGMKSNLDWDRWDELSKLEGAFAYSPKALMLHRIHDDAETSKLVGQNARTVEDYEMFIRFHAKPVAKLISKVYSVGEKAYK